MQKLYLNTTERVWYDADGSQPSDSNPQIPLGNTEKIIIQCCSLTPDAGTPGINPETDWEKDTQFDLPGVTALLSCDNNFTRRLKGSLKTAVEAGSVNSVVLTISNVTPGMIPQTGAIQIFGVDGEPEGLEYIRRTISGTDVTFELAPESNVAQSYASNSVANCPEALYAQSALNVAESDPGNGLFVFDITMDSLKLREKADYANAKSIDDVKGLELLIFTVNGDDIETRNAYICDTFTVPVPMAEPNPNPQMPETYRDTVASMISALLAYGFQLQFSVDGASQWHDIQDVSDLYFRFRSSASGVSGEWSNPVKLPQGSKGDSVYPYVAYAKDSNGTGFTLEWQDDAQLNYVAYKMSDSIIANPQAADFSGLWVRFKGEDMVPYWEDGSGTAIIKWDSISGVPESFPPSEHTHTKDNISDCARQTLLECSSATVIPDISKEILHYAINSSQVTFNFTAINSGGIPYTGSPGDVFTWELWVDAGRTLEDVSFGSASDMYVLPGFPELLPLINGQPTRHVFTLRGRYKDGVPNNIKLILNYAYSEEV